MSKKPILCLDFDGVIHSYTSGWQGADVIPDPPVPGALEFIVKALEHFELHIFSSRSNQPGGQRAMQKYLLQHYRQLALNREETPDWLRRYIERYECSWDATVIQATLALTCNDIGWPTEKPPAFLTIDDRAITFDGTWPNLDELASFEPWNKREPFIGTSFVDEDGSSNPAFDRWAFKAESKLKINGESVPLMTELLHRVCNGNRERFDAAIDILKEAFEAGRKSWSAQ